MNSVLWPILEDEPSVYKATIKKGIFQNQKSLSALKRRQDCIAPSQTQPQGPWVEEDFPDLHMDIAQLLGIADRLVARVQKRSDIVFQAIRESETDIIPSPMSIHLSNPSSPVQLPLQSIPSFDLSPLPTVPASSFIIPVPTSTTAIAPLQRNNAVTTIITSTATSFLSSQTQSSTTAIAPLRRTNEVTAIIPSTATSSISSPTPSLTTIIAPLQRTNEVTAVIASTANTLLSSQTPSSTNLSPINTSSVRPVPAMMSTPAATLQAPINANLPSLPTTSVFNPPSTISHY
ncbi:hypothetical protein DPMN_138817 [Dreissena polymorpha]|uniref:Uncharacterized protein n=1 Tax=Dreissena polymorpha TaxID=45954 RepID=A0A9D4JFY6_DREPO|nr:hypothetical protein DPMN_138817 [Dreissena polymorpha]